MELNEDLAEVVGTFIGDGCISNFRDRQVTRRLVMFTGSYENDTPYYVEKIKPIIKKWLHYERKLYHRKDDNTIRYVIYSKGVIDFFKELGLPTGKKEDKIEIPKQILEHEKLALACVRGIFNTDGSVYSRYSKKYDGHARVYRNYAVIQFKMINHKVINQIKKILENQAIKVNRITKVNNCSVIRITDQSSIKIFVEKIGFTHTYHERRYLKIIAQ